MAIDAAIAFGVGEAVADAIDPAGMQFDEPLPGALVPGEAAIYETGIQV